MIKLCLLLNLSMSSTGSLSIKDSAFGSGHCKRLKKKRHRNKFRNSNLRKKRLKKYYSVKKTNSFKLTNPKCNPDSDKIMSNWYWSNYKRAVEWQERHKTAYWKACALALLEENRYLLQIISDIQPGMVPKVSITQSNLGEGINYNRKHLKVNPAKYFTSVHVSGSIHNVDAVEDEGDEYNDNGDVKDEEDDDIEFEMSEEMMQFFKQSYRHKMNLKKLKEKELLNEAEQKIKQIQTNKIKRSTEMNLLYGDEASMIIGMETAIQLSFDKYCDTKSPKYWPNIPFRL